MSLTSFISIPEVNKKFTEEFPTPPIESKPKILCLPKTTHYGLVGTAFDYLLRFYIKYHNPSAFTSRWVADSAVELIKKIPELFTKTSSILQHCKEIYEGYLKSGEMNDEVIKSTIYLAQLDPIFRAGKIDKKLGVVDKEDIEDLNALICNVEPRTFKAKKLCALNPTFGEGSILVGGADADLLIDDTLIDVKTTKYFKLEKSYYHQLIGYYILFKIGGITRHEAGRMFRYRGNLEIKKLGIYFSRHGYLLTIPIEAVLKSTNFEDFTKWFESKAKQYSDEKARAHEQARRRYHGSFLCREFQTLFKVLRKAVIYHQYNNLKQTGMYLGMTKREWGFIRSKGENLPGDVSETVEKLLQKIYHPDPGVNMSSLESKIRQNIMESLKEKLPPEIFAEFREKLAKQDEVLRNKIKS